MAQKAHHKHVQARRNMLVGLEENGICFKLLMIVGSFNIFHSVQQDNKNVA